MGATATTERPKGRALRWEPTEEDGHAGALVAHAGAESVTVFPYRHAGEEEAYSRIYGSKGEMLQQDHHADLDAACSWAAEVAAQARDEGRALAAVAKGRSRAEARARWFKRVLAPLLGEHPHELGIPGGSGMDGFLDEREDSVRILFAELHRRGFRMAEDGALVPVWRERARGRWVDADRTFLVPGDDPTGAVARVECGLLVHVWDAGDGEWTADVEGESPVDFPSKRDAQEWGVRKARQIGRRS